MSCTDGILRGNVPDNRNDAALDEKDMIIMQSSEQLNKVYNLLYLFCLLRVFNPALLWYNHRMHASWYLIRNDAKSY